MTISTDASRKLPSATPPSWYAGGAPISEAVADQAADWLTRLMANEVDAAERRRWQAWRNSHPDHERAWQHIEAVAARLRGLHPGAAYQTLSPLAKPASGNRRQLLAAVFGLGIASGAGILGTRYQVFQELAADYRTGTGEQRQITLADGSRITLNTASAINVRFAATRRVIRLVAGEIHIVTGHADPVAAVDRPFIVETGEGTIRALGTRFTVHQQDGQSRVDVFASAVEITPAEAPESAAILHQGKHLSFTRNGIGHPGPAAEQAEAWARGQLTADNVRLGDFLADLGRYRAGLLRCDPAVADLRFSGVFPIRDTDKILAMLPNSLPVQVQWRTPYWVTVSAAPPGKPGR